MIAGWSSNSGYSLLGGLCALAQTMSFKRICNVLLGNHKAANYQDAVQDLLT
jgi:NADH:ubiquinone oxidoreductase subunit H